VTWERKENDLKISGARFQILLSSCSQIKKNEKITKGNSSSILFYLKKFSKIY